MAESLEIPGYTIEKEIGRGAMATVFLAVQDTLERRVAIKLMSSSLLTDETFQKRFLKEGKIIAQLNHPNIVTIYDIGMTGNDYYMTMEYVEGAITLRDKIIDGQGVAVEDALRILVQVASALGYAHKRNFVHRDVKPANILLREDGTAVLSDFGIAKTLGEGTAMTRQGWAVGTPSYMSPEQALGQGVDPRCDIYSLGVVLYEMLVGGKPYQADDSFAVALKHVNDPIPTLPSGFEDYQPLIDNMMAKKPEDRYADADALINAVRELKPYPLTGTSTLPSPASNKAQRTSADLGLSDSIKPAPAKFGAKHWSWLIVSGTVALAAAAVWLNRPLLEEWFSPVPEPCVLDSPLSEAQQRQIEGLLDAAQFNIEVERFVNPPISNAAYGLQQILSINRCHELAQQLMAELPAKIITKVQARQEQGEMRQALELVRSGLAFFPANKALLALQQDLASEY